ncbi:MAG: PAS domain S-box protein [Chloroflexota bacterium]
MTDKSKIGRPSKRAIISMRIVGVYILVGAVWILTTDSILAAIIRDRDTLSVAQTFKGWVFIAVTGLLLYGLIRWGMHSQRESEEALLESKDTLRRRNAELAALHETTLDLVNRLDQNSLLDAIVARASSLVSTPHAFLYVVEQSPAGEPQLVLRAAVGRFAPSLGYTLKYGQGLSGRVWQTGEIVNVADYSSWPERCNDLDSMLIRALAGVPLFANGRIAGVIGLAHFDPASRIDAAELALLERFSAMASVALENARLYTVAQQELIEHERTEEALIASEGRYRMILEQAAEGIFVTDLQGNFLEASSTGCEMFGYTRDELLHKNLWDLATPEDIAQTSPNQAEISGGNVLVRERQAMRKDGSSFPSETSSKMLPDGRVQTIIRDVTERKAYEQHLEEHSLEQAHLLSRLVTAQEAERRRLSMEIHDGPLQSLGVSLLAYDRIIRRLERQEYEEMLHELRYARDITIGIVDDVRAILSDLSLELLNSYGLTPALREQIERFSQVTDITVQLHDEIDKRLPSQTELLMYRLAQEALANIRKHAGATHADISFCLEEHRITMIISDNGKGFDTSQPFRPQRAGENIGLPSMRQRIQDAQGGMTIYSSPGKGTTLTFWCPIPSSGAEMEPAAVTVTTPPA